jgi:hypothetical protein
MPITSSGRQNSQACFHRCVGEYVANPIGLLSDCHRRIERFLQALRTVATKAAGGSLEAEHRRALEALSSIFAKRGRNTADEEEDLLPMRRELASPCIPTVLADLDRLEAEHTTAEARHREVEELCQRWLRQNFLPPEDAARLNRLLKSLSALYPDHISLEPKRRTFSRGKGRVVWA